ncbi:MAG: hypothetical protein ABIK67_04795 [candidate division WOR-3 bacterium]
MHKSTKLLVLGFCVLGIMVWSCHRTTPKALRIVEINNGQILTADTQDEWTTGSGEELEEHSETPSYSVEVEVSYTERGTGLPTYPTAYTAEITDYTVTFKDITPGATPGEFAPAPVKGVCYFVVPSDPAGKKTVKQSILVLPAAWIDQYPELEDGKVLNAKITLRGKDMVSNLEINGEGILTINIANFEDDPQKRGE